MGGKTSQGVLLCRVGLDWMVFLSSGPNYSRILGPGSYGVTLSLFGMAAAASAARGHPPVCAFLSIPSAKTHQKPEIRSPNFSQVKVTDLFHRLVRTVP